MARRFILNRVEGDTKPDIDVEFASFDLTGFQVKMHTKKSGSASTQTKDAVIDDAASGKFHIEFVSSDLLLRRGKHEIEFEFIDGSGNFSIPSDDTIIVDVRADIR